MGNTEWPVSFQKHHCVFQAQWHGISTKCFGENYSREQAGQGVATLYCSWSCVPGIAFDHHKKTKSWSWISWFYSTQWQPLCFESWYLLFFLIVMLQVLVLFYWDVSVIIICMDENGIAWLSVFATQNTFMITIKKGGNVLGRMAELNFLVNDGGTL